MTNILVVVFTLAATVTSYRIGVMNGTATITNGQVAIGLGADKHPENVSGWNGNVGMHKQNSQVVNLRHLDVEKDTTENNFDIPQETELNTDPGKELHTKTSQKEINNRDSDYDKHAVLEQNGQAVGVVADASISNGINKLSQKEVNASSGYGENSNVTNDKDSETYTGYESQIGSNLNGTNNGAEDVLMGKNDTKYGVVEAQNGQVVIGVVSGGTFGTGSFTVNAPGRNESNTNYPGPNTNYPGPNTNYSKPNTEYSRPVIQIGSAQIETNNGTMEKDKVVLAQNGQVVIGELTGGSFGIGSFTNNKPGHNDSNGSHDEKQNKTQYGDNMNCSQNKPHNVNNQIKPSNETYNEVSAQNNHDENLPMWTRNLEERRVDLEHIDKLVEALDYLHHMLLDLRNRSNPNGEPDIGTGDETNIAIDQISGGSYPDNSFSIGHGKDSENTEDGKGDILTIGSTILPKPISGSQSPDSQSQKLN